MIGLDSNVAISAWKPRGVFRPEFVRDFGDRRELEKYAELLEVSEVHNLVPDSGLNYTRDLLAGAVSRIDEIAVGDGSTAAVAGDTALGNEQFRDTIDRRLQFSKRVSFQMLILQSENNGNTIEEVGLFKSSTLIARAVISPAIVKSSAIFVTVVHDITLSNV